MPISGPAPFGYIRRDGRLVPHPDEAKVRQRMYELFLEHRRKKTVADILNAEGHRSRNGAFFTGQGISRLLSDERVVGISGEIDALIARSVFEEVENILNTQKSQGGVKRKPQHLFAGLAFCHCGDRMYVLSNSKKYTCRGCKSKILTSDLEAVFVEQLKMELTGTNLMSLVDRWVTLNFEVKRGVIETVTDRISVDTESSEIIISFVDL